MGILIGRARTVAVVGLDAVPVTVEAHVSTGLPGFVVIGSSGVAARQAAERVRTALMAIGVALGARKVLVSLAPADVPKAGARFDLAMAVAVLGALGVLGQDTLDRVTLLGELALDGGVRPVPGVLPSTAALGADATRLFVAAGNAAEAALSGRAEVVAVADLAEAVAVLQGEQAPRNVADLGEVGGLGGAGAGGDGQRGEGQGLGGDLGDVRGQSEARRALEIAAAGGHHLLLLGPPGCGKSMLARRLPSLLPPLDDQAALVLASVRSVAGVLGDRPVFDRRPPLRAPHHTVSAAGLLGGGSGIARPGEISLATQGVLFLDELFEWPRGVLESLREPLEEGVVRVTRARATVTYPAQFQLVAAANPCPCGGGSSTGGGCGCGDDAIWAYRTRLSGPLADRLDLAPMVAPLRAEDLVGTPQGESSAQVAQRVAVARQRSTRRWGPRPNAVAPTRAVRATASAGALAALAQAVEAGLLTGRGFDRALRVARTIADLDGAREILAGHALEACGHRLQLRAASQPLGVRGVGVA